MKEEPPESPPPPPPRKRMSWLRREGIDLGDAAVQFFAVVVGIVLGVFITQWVAQRQQRHAAQEALHAIRMELRANRATLHKNAAYWHQHVVHVIAASGNLKSSSPRHCYLWPGWSGSHTEVAQVTDAAYQTAIATHAMAHMPFQQAHSVARIYGLQQQQHEVQTFLLRHFIYSGQHSLRRCVGIMESFEKNNYIVSAEYSPLIGRDDTKWPTPPPLPRNTSTPSK